MLKFFSKKSLLLFAGIVVLTGLSAIIAVLIYFSSPGFKETARSYLVHEIELETGGHATLGRVHWNLWTRRISLLDLTVRGTEPADSAPLAHVESIEAGINFRSLLNRKVDLFELIVTRPELHILVDSKGNTNIPGPPPHNAIERTDFAISIENFKVSQGSAFVNERQVNVDFVLKNLNSDLSYQGVTRILTAKLSYDGVLERSGEPSIPYSLSSDFDFSRGTLLAKHVVFSTGKSQIQMQGRINEVLTSSIAGKLEYSGTAAVPFMNYFFPKETFAGESTVAGSLEFSRAGFHTLGNAKSKSLSYSRWTVTEMRSDYDYRYPEKRLTVEHFSAGVFGGTAEGKLSIDSLPGASRVNVSLSYKDFNGVLMARDFPWEPKFRIESRITGTLQGWLEGRLEQYEFTGDAALASAMQKAETGIVSLPVDGHLTYAIRPGHVTVTNANMHFLSTSLLADGSIEPETVSLRVHLASSDLTNLSFLYTDANGVGSFDGMLNGPIKTPRAEGAFDLQRSKYREWTVERVSGTANLDTMANTAVLSNVRAVQGQSVITLNGNAALDGTKIDMRIQAVDAHAEDAAPFVKQKFGGIMSGTIRLTSLNPLRFDGDVRATGLALQGQTLQQAQSHVHYDAPLITLQNLTASDNGSTITGTASYSDTTEAMTFDLHINAVDLKRLRTFGMPDAIEGRIQQADLKGGGTPKHPEVDGTARLQNLMFHGETFPSARVDLKTDGPEVELKLSETRNLGFTARIDTVKPGYPFKAQATFIQYSIEKLAGFARGTLTASGNANLSGKLNDIAHISGSGRIDAMEIGAQSQMLQSNKPFAFDFNSDRLKLIDEVALISSKGLQLKMNGTVGLTSTAKLDLKLTGQVEAGILLPKDAPWNVAGSLNLNCNIGGTVTTPNLQGQASFTDLSVARQGVTTSLTALKGDVIFDEHRMTLNNVEGRSGPGTVRLQGTGMIEGDTIGTLNLRVEASGVRLRYPTGMRSVIDGSLRIGGKMASPSVSGDVQIQSLTFNSSFEEFLALFSSAGEFEGTSPFGNTQLSLRVVGSRNISIHNELASAEAQIDLGIKGTIDRPALTGHVETSSGTLLFQGKKYDVTRGNIDFIDPARIDPVININAETTVRSYQVYLSISGRMNRLQLNMRSEPPLPQLEIVNLISGGKTTDELARSAKAIPTGEQVFQGGAASILSDMLVSRVGSKLNLLGLDRIVRIDPFAVGAQNATTARITLSENLTKDLSVTYSSELATNKQQIIQVEYFVTKNISILASKDENDVRGLDLRIRRRF